MRRVEPPRGAPGSPGMRAIAGGAQGGDAEAGAEGGDGAAPRVDWRAATRRLMDEAYTAYTRCRKWRESVR